MWGQEKTLAWRWKDQPSQSRSCSLLWCIRLTSTLWMRTTFLINYEMWRKISSESRSSRYMYCPYSYATVDTKRSVQSVYTHKFGNIMLHCFIWLIYYKLCFAMAAANTNHTNIQKHNWLQAKNLKRRGEHSPVMLYIVNNTCKSCLPNTLVLCCSVSEISLLELLYAESHFFDTFPYSG